MRTAFKISFCFLLAACVKREKIPLIPEEAAHTEEVITTVKVALTDSATAAVTWFEFADPDGPGGNPPYYGAATGSVISLQSGSIYFAEVLLLNESVIPADTVSSEVNEEGEEHMIFFDNGEAIAFSAHQPSTVQIPGGPEIIYVDSDQAEVPLGIGLFTKWRCPAGSGATDLRITLKHQPEGKRGNFDDGETDVQIFFRIVIK